MGMGTVVTYVGIVMVLGIRIMIFAVLSQVQGNHYHYST